MKAEDITAPGGAGELEYLRQRAATANIVLEIGCWHGRSTHAMCEVCPGVVYAVDAWCGEHKATEPWYWCDPKVIADSRDNFFANLLPYLRSGKLIFYKGNSFTTVPCIPKMLNKTLWIDFAFIDGGHDYDTVLRDIRAVKPLMRPGGILSGHDFDYPDVARAVKEELRGVISIPTRIWEWQVPS